jgi:hypothetical protein
LRFQIDQANSLCFWPFYRQSETPLNRRYFNDKCTHPGRGTSSGKCKHFHDCIEQTFGRVLWPEGNLHW